MASTIHPVTIPKWGIEMQEGTITEWRADVGDAITKGQELVDIESDKIVNTLEAPADGVLRRCLMEVEDTLDVGELIGVIAQADTSEEDIEAFIAAYVPADAASFGIGDELETVEEAPEPEPEKPAPAPEPVAAEPAPAAKPGGRASPVARRLAQKLGVDLSQVVGTGRNGRISTEDVEAAARASVPEPEPEPQAEPQGIALNSRQLAQARRMTESKTTIPHFYLTRDLDMTAALARKKADGTPVTALIVRAMLTAAAEVPAVTRHLVDNQLFEVSSGINIAVDTDEGLVAPLLPLSAGDSAADIAERLKALASRARERSLEKSDLQPGGITLSNLGMFGISQFTAIINPPQVAILATGNLRPIEIEIGKPAVPAMTATLSCDHRAVDGATGARYLAALQEAIHQL